MAQVERPSTIGVLGPGAVGGLIAALYWRAGYRVVCIGTSRTVESIAKSGITVRSVVYGDFVSHPEATQLLTSPVDILFVTVKSPFLPEALSRIVDGMGDATAVVSLLNGLGHREAIRRQLGSHVVVGTIGAVEVALSEDGVVQHRSPMRPHIDIASEADVDAQTLRSIMSGIEHVGLSGSIAQSESAVIWNKLVRLCAIATMTTFSQSPLGNVRSNSALREQLETIVNEVAKVAVSEGTDIRADQVMQQIDGLPGTLTTSLQRDVYSGSPSEIEAIVGEVLRLGQKHEFSLPELESAYSSIQERIGRQREPDFRH